jgi:ATP/maltotriose-dependent transcriptional regulator MalT
MGETSTIAESQVTLADLSLEEGHADLVEPLLRAAIAEFEKEKSDPDTASGYLVLSRALLAEGKLDEAREAVKRAAELTVTSPDPAMKLPIAIQTARVERGAALKARDHAMVSSSIQKLRSLIASAKKLGYYEMECEARLDVAEAELRIDPARARSQLEILEKETHTWGLEFLSHKAQGLIAVSQPSQSARSSPSPP